MRSEKEDTYQYIEKLTLELVNTPSMVRSDKENDGAKKIFEIVSRLPYFVDHPENIMVVPLEADALERHCIFAYVQGSASADTVILLSHFDTVDIDGYGQLSPFAFDPPTLKEKMKALKFNRDVEADLHSPDWLFGRGVVDMKSGIALNIWAIRQFSADPDSLKGNILFISTPDEEAMAHGSFAAVKRLIQFKQEKNLNFVGLINTDYTAPLYEGDANRYIYTGSIGKFLLSFFVCGLATHAGECLEGLDANLVTSHLVTRFSMNCDFSDEADGAMTPPPISLKQKDLKEVYNVLIPYEAVTYFNFFSFTRSPAEILSIAKREANMVINDISAHVNTQKRIFYSRSNIPFTKKLFDASVYTYDEFYRKTILEKPDLKNKLHALERAYILDETDETKLSLALTRKLVEESTDFYENKPLIIIYFSPPYVPRVHVKNETATERKFHRAIQQAVANSSCPIQIKPFFPYISDMSWYGMADTIEDIKCIKANTPGFARTCPLALESASSLNIPTVNIGPYGKDAHEATERLFMPYAFETLPKLLTDTIKNLLSE